jgi:hypothetical protein
MGDSLAYHKDQSMFNDLIGIPFKEHGRSKEGLDCLGLVLEVQNRLGFYVKDPCEYRDVSGTPIFIENYGKYWKQVDKPEIGDAVLVTVKGEYPDHVCVYMGDKVLDVNEGTSVCLRKNPYKKIYGYFRPVKLENTSDHIKIIVKDHLFSTTKEIKTIFTGNDIWSYIDDHYQEGMTIVLNGKRVDGEEIPGLGDEIILTRLPGIGAPIVAAIAGVEITAFTTGLEIAAIAINLVTSFALSLLIGALIAPPKPSGETEEEGSPTFDLTGIKNSIRPGGVIPVIYGEIPTGGQIIQVFNKIEQDRTVLYMLLALGHGEIDSISGLGEVNDLSSSIPDTIKIDGNPASSYRGVSVSTRLGKVNQTVIPGFSDSVSAYPYSVTLTSAEPSFTHTCREDVTAFEVQLYLPEGLVNYSSSGSPGPRTLTWQVDWRMVGNTTWNTSGWLQRIASTRAPFSLSYRKDNLTRGKYEIKVTRVAPPYPETAPDHASRSDLVAINEIDTDAGYSYPGIALLAVKAIASDQLQGNIPTVQCEPKGKKVWVWDGVSETSPNFTFQYSDNPAWCVFDVLTNRTYGAGNQIYYDYVDLSKFRDAASFFDTQVSDGRTGNITRHTSWVFDKTTNAWEASQLLLAPHRAGIIQSGKKIKIKIEQASSPTQLFTRSNIIQGSFKGSIKSVRDMPNIVSVEFRNEETNIENDIAQVRDTGSIAAGDPIREQSISYPGITSPSLAYRAAKYALNVARNIREQISFEAPIEALAIEPGDVFAFQHDTLFTGSYSSRISNQGAGYDYITLDKDLTVSGVNKVIVRSNTTSGDIVGENQILTSGTYLAGSAISLTGSFSFLPKEGDPVSIGTTGNYRSYYRATNIALDTSRMVFSIDAVEYNPDIYDDDPGTVPSSTEDLPDPKLIPDNVTIVRAKEISHQLKDGTILPGLHVSWTPVLGAKEYEVYIRRVEQGLDQ